MSKQPQPPPLKTSPGHITPTQILKLTHNKSPTNQSDLLATEEPLEIRVHGRSVAVTMRTPGHDHDLAAGFLLTEGVLNQPTDLRALSHCPAAAVPANTLNVALAPDLHIDFTQLTRHVFASSSCGLCGKTSIDSIHRRFPPVNSNFALPASTLINLPRRMRAAQQSFNRTGGLHAAAIFDSLGRLLVLREDVGRHNAVDKAIGSGFLSGPFPFDQHLLLVSGRASFEIIQKALAARIPVVCAISAPSSLAVQFARESRQTLVGFLRGRSFNVYSNPERLTPS